MDSNGKTAIIVGALFITGQTMADFLAAPIAVNEMVLAIWAIGKARAGELYDLSGDG